MQEMDGLKSSKDDNIMVIGATNRPFDLDDAVLRRLPRRLLVDLPGEKEREGSSYLLVLCIPFTWLIAHVHAFSGLTSVFIHCFASFTPRFLELIIPVCAAQKTTKQPF